MVIMANLYSFTGTTIFLYNFVQIKKKVNYLCLTEKIIICQERQLILLIPGVCPWNTCEKISEEKNCKWVCLWKIKRKLNKKTKIKIMEKKKIWVQTGLEPPTLGLLNSRPYPLCHEAFWQIGVKTTLWS